MIKLFRVVSTVNNFPHRGRTYDGVEIHWFVVYRENPIASYEKLINGYLKDRDNPLYISEKNLQELFTEEEADALKEYLSKKHGEECDIREADLSTEIDPWGYGDKTPAYREGFYRLNQEDGYDLPFVVWGYYDISHAKDVTWLMHGVESLETVLDKFGLEVTDVDTLKTIMEEMKNRGLLVKREFRSRKRITY
jgi:hypothetical protein